MKNPSKDRNYTAPLFIAVVSVFLSISGCGKKESEIDPGPTEEINEAVSEDRKLKESTEDLLEKRGALIRLRSKLHKQRSDLENRRQSLTEGDEEGAAAIRMEEEELAKREQDLEKQEVDLNQKLSQILDQRSTLLAQATSALSAATAAVDSPNVARREHSVSQREGGIAQRENELAAREARIAKREADIAQREKELLQGCAAMAIPTYTVTTIETPQKGAPGVRNYTSSHVKAAYDKALHVMSARGILDSDLPPGVSKLKSEVLSHLKNKEYYRGKLAADQFLTIVRNISIDRGFIGAKMARLHKRMAKRKLSPEREKKINDLFVKATRAYSNGRFGEANSILNRIFSLAR